MAAAGEQTPPYLLCPRSPRPLLHLHLCCHLRAACFHGRRAPWRPTPGAFRPCRAAQRGLLPFSSSTHLPHKFSLPCSSSSSLLLPPRLRPPSSISQLPALHLHRRHSSTSSQRLRPHLRPDVCMRLAGRRCSEAAAAALTAVPSGPLVKTQNKQIHSESMSIESDELEKTVE